MSKASSILRSISPGAIQASSKLRPHDRREYLLAALWVLSMISLPVAGWVAGNTILPFWVSLSVVIQIAAVWVALNRDWGWQQTTRVVIVVIALAWLTEFIGSRMGIPFGAYQYTSQLQPQLFGVPILIPLAWMMMLPCAWSIAGRIVSPAQSVRFALVAAAAFTAWDFFLDPQMVRWNFWVWEDPVGYFGIPWMNFLGWFVMSGLITFIVRPPPVKSNSLLLIYVITWILETIGLTIFWGLPGPAVFAFVTMGSFVGLAYFRK